MEGHDDSFEVRLERLESRCRRLAAVCGVLGAILGAACLSSAARGDGEVLRAKRIEVLGKDGEARILMLGDFGVPDGSGEGAGIWLWGVDGALSGWTVGRSRDEGSEAWRNFGDFFLETSETEGEGGAQIQLFVGESRGALRVGSDELGYAKLEAAKRKAALEIRDFDSEGEEDDDDPLRIRLGLVDGRPVLQALDPSGETVFEQH